MENTNLNNLFHNGAKSFISDNFKEAVDSFTQILETDKSNFQAFLYRASSYIKLKNYNNALSDLEEAQKLNSNSFECNYKKGMASFKSEKFIDANDSFKKALALATHTEQREKLVIWSNKLEIELEENDLLSKLTTKISNDTDELSNVKIIHSWYQTPTHITLSLDSNTILSKENFDFVIEKKSIKIHSKSGLVWEMNLSNGINVDCSSVILNNNKKAEIKLKKEIDHFNWVTLDRAKVSEVTSRTANIQPSYPTSSQVKKDWDNLEKEITQELANDAKNDPNEGMMRLFKEIYGNASEETRRAMVKSFQTSGGTVLSTNWDEVKEKDYEGRDKPDAPNGQEWKKSEI